MSELVFQRRIQDLPEYCLQCGRYVDKRWDAVIFTRYDLEQAAIVFTGPWCSDACYQTYIAKEEGGPENRASVQ